MNNIAISPYICLHALQIQNIKRDVVKKVSINQLNVSDFKNDNKNDNKNEEFNQILETKPDIDIDIGDSTNINDLPIPISSNDNNINIGSKLL